jgi:hypothetical protein
MGWSIGFDGSWNRDIGYGVPATCDHPGCGALINRGLSYVCANEEPYGGEHGCGLYFCSAHLFGAHKHDGYCCERCNDEKEPFDATPDHPDWINWKLTHSSWQQWRDESPDEVAALRAAIS